MAVDDSVIAAIETALAVAPENAALRRHLAQVLLDAGRAEAALEHCRALLARAPDDVATLEIAATAAERSGDIASANSYRRMHSALSGAAPAPVDERIRPVSNVVPLRVIAGGASERVQDVEEQAARVTLADVAGMDEVKRRLELAFLGPLRRPDLMRAYGKSLRGGLLLYGPPGCGKTYVARAVAGELGARFIAVGLADVLDMWMGQSERNLHELFETARRAAPSVLFLDEVDALGRKRALQRHSAMANVVNQLLAELDGVQAENKGVFVLAATNHPWDVDAALRRPGRFDRTVLVLPPDVRAREAILRAGLRERPLAADVDPVALARRTEDFSGADLTHLCQSAAELAIAESLSSGGIAPIRQQHFEHALREMRPSTRAWIDTAKNYVMFANEGGIYDDLQNYLRARRLL
jgi:SpoVK/Ycf46/Vps4 family AAA+-type ATPase